VNGTPEKLEAKYANYFQIGENAVEFILEFGQLYGNEGAPLLHTRIITSPVYAKHLLTVLEEALEKHERQFGAISEF
jgi:hypothetical protein